MSQTKEGALKARAKMVEKFGGEERYLNFMRSIAAVGGKVSIPRTKKS